MLVMDLWLGLKEVVSAFSPLDPDLPKTPWEVLMHSVAEDENVG